MGALAMATRLLCLSTRRVSFVTLLAAAGRGIESDGVHQLSLATDDVCMLIYILALYARGHLNNE